MSEPHTSVLVVAAAPEIIEAVREPLADAGVAMAIAPDLASAVEHAGTGALRVVVADLGNLGEDAFELCRWLRADPVTRNVSLLGIVDAEDVELLERAVSAGMDDFILAPASDTAVIARVRAQHRAATLRMDLAQRSEDLELLLELTRQFTSSLNIDTILGSLVTRLADAIGVSRCSLVLTDENRGRGVVLAASDDLAVHDLEIDLRDYPEIKAVLDTGEPLVVSDVATHPVLEPVRHTLAAKGVGALALFPLVFEDAILGVLFLRTSTEGEPFDERRLGFAVTVAHATAVALRNARLFEHIRDDARRAADQRLRAERQIEDLKEYEDLYEHVGEGILLVADDGRVRGANPSARQSLEHCGALEGQHLTDLGLAREDREALAELVAGREKGRTIEVRVPAGEGTRVLSLTLSPLSDGGAVASFRDVTEARRVEDELRNTKRFLENLFESSADAIVAADRRGTILLWNKAAERITGYSAADAEGRMHVNDIYPDGQSFEIMAAMRSERGGGPGRVEETRAELLARSGERVPVSLSAAILYEGGAEVGTMGIFTDLRERLRIEARLTQAQERLILTEKQAMLAELAGTAAHELNQPLTSVMGYAEILQANLAADDASQRALDIIVRESERMAEIVRKIGRITRYETKAYLGETRIVDLDKAAEGDAEGPGVLPDEDDDVKLKGHGS